MNKNIKFILFIGIIFVIIISIMILNNNKKEVISNNDVANRELKIQEIEDISSDGIKYKVYDANTNELLMELTESEKETQNMYKYDPNFYIGDGISEE